MKHHIQKCCILLVCLFCLFHLTSAQQTRQTKQNVPVTKIYEQYLAQAQAFADAYPREKAYLHFDNTGYYAGDTIWYKAYVTLAEKKTASPISRPLYVELLDQTGHVFDKQIVKLSEGTGNGQFILPRAMMSGYYEIRAFTRWMLGFDEAQYFSRTFPVYRLSDKGTLNREISNYRLNSDMEQRPDAYKEKFTIQFFPEGGQLVQGVPSEVAFKAESRDEGSVELSGELYTDGGEKLASFATLHDGMGHFSYTPSAKPAVARVKYKHKLYKFELPKALETGYVVKVTNGGGALSVEVSCNTATPQDTLALFLSHQGRPYMYQPVICKGGQPQTFVIRTRKVPEGITQVSLVNREGTTLCERFCFLPLQSNLQIIPSGLKSVYTPYKPVCCTLQVTDGNGLPVQTELSVAVRDAARSDYLEYDNNLLTDMLLTSDLKGYIHQPGYYFADLSLRKLEELDVLLMVHGWRKYDMSQLIGVKEFVPRQVPETQLALHGQVKSAILRRELKDILVSVVARKDSIMIAGQTTTDANGRFSLPVDDFRDVLEAVFQTRKAGKSHNKDVSVLLDRNFSPALRSYDYAEEHPRWVDTEKWLEAVETTDSLYMDSVRHLGNTQLLDEVVVKAKRRSGMETHYREQSIDAYYDIRQMVDKMRDEGKVVITLPELLEDIDMNFSWNRQSNEFNEATKATRRNENSLTGRQDITDMSLGADSIEMKTFYCTYRNKPICYIMDGQILSSADVSTLLSEVDGMKSIVICKGSEAVDDEILANSRVYDETDAQSVNIMELDKYMIFYLTPLPNRNIYRRQRSATGMRQTIIQGYAGACEFYSPVYKDELPPLQPDKRRTLYWNPTVKTDEQGKAVIQCFNGDYTAPLVISVETLKNGVPGTMIYSTVK